MLIALTAELKKALMHKLFTEGTRGEPQKQTEIGPVPESWDLMRAEELLLSYIAAMRLKATITRSLQKASPIIKIGDIQDVRAIQAKTSTFQEFWTDSRLAQFRLTRDALLIAFTGATTGKTGQFDSTNRAFLNQRVGRFIPDIRYPIVLELPCPLSRTFREASKATFWWLLRAI